MTRPYLTNAESSEATGQSVQSKLHTDGEHRPSGPTTAEPDDSEHYAWARSSMTRDQWRRWSPQEES
jgi:hypothetical protein